MAKNFATAMEFINKVAEIAEREGVSDERALRDLHLHHSMCDSTLVRRMQ